MAGERYLIVNADDFGQSAGINRGIVTAHEQEIVTSASLMVRWQAAARAAEYAREHPEFSVGLHVDLGEWAFRDGDWVALYDEIAAFKQAAGPARLKAILGTGDLVTLRNVARASWVAMMAGADFIKTSTGKEAVNATLPVSLTMVRCIREYAERTGMAVGFKPAGKL